MSHQSPVSNLMVIGDRMNCDEASRELSAYRDGELEPSRQTAIAAHLADCPICRAHLRDLVRIGRMLRSGAPATVPDGVWERLAAAAATETTRFRRRRVWSLRAAGLAAGFVIYLSGYGALETALEARRRQTPPSVVRAERALRESQALLADAASVSAVPGFIEHRPESRFLDELTKDATP
jgi:anti-sigma factor RsiW